VKKMKKMGNNILGKGMGIAIAVTPDKAVIHGASGVFKDVGELSRIVQKAIDGKDLGTLKSIVTETLPDKTVRATITGTKKDITEFAKFANVVLSEATRVAKKHTK
jgi:hypothetical protein